MAENHFGASQITTELYRACKSDLAVVSVLRDSQRGLRRGGVTFCRDRRGTHCARWSHTNLPACSTTLLAWSQKMTRGFPCTAPNPSGVMGKRRTPLLTLSIGWPGTTTCGAHTQNSMLQLPTPRTLSCTPEVTRGTVPNVSNHPSVTKHFKCLRWRYSPISAV